MGEGVLHIEEYLREAFTTMNNLRNHQELCDIVLCVGNMEIHAHRLVLASCSPYFYAMFTNNLAESKQSVVTLKGMDPKCVETLIDFAYTADITVNESNVQSLLPVASLLQIACVQKACCTYLESQLDPTNCLGILSFAELHGCDVLASKSRHYYSRYFSNVCRAEEFLSITEERLCSLIDGDGLCVKNEDEVLLAAVRWIQHDIQNRRHSLIRLLSHIRLPFVSPGFMQSLYQSSDDITLLQLLSEVYETFSSNVVKTCMKKRCPLGPHVMYIVGGYLRQSLRVVECYYPHHNSWSLLKSLQQPRSGAGAAFVGGMLYIIGGRNNSLSGNVDCDSVDRYDPLLDEWKSVCSLTVPRNRVGIGVIDGYVYAIGGSHGNLYLNLVEKYDADEDRWVEVAPLTVPRIGVGVAVIDRKLYAVGGFDGVRRLDSVECYDTASDKWTLVSSMKSARSGAAVAAANNYAYALGGYNGTTQLNSVERYDPRLDEWTLVSCMLDHRSALSVASFENKLYVFGGYDGEKFHDTVEVYDCEQDCWEVASSMSMGRSGAAVVVGVRPAF